MKKLIELYLNVYHFWMRLPEKLRYLLVGGYNTVVSYGLYALFVWLGQAPQPALFLSFIVSSVNSYWTQKVYVFGTKGNCKKEYAKCAVSWGISYGMNVLLLELFLKLGMNKYLAQVFGLALVTVNSYFMLKYIAFQNHKGVNR